MNIERNRARHALDTIEALQKQTVDKYVSYVKALPATILQNGLGQAMATLLAAAKGKPAMKNGAVNETHRLLYNHIQDWLCRDAPNAPYPVTQKSNDNSTILMTRITNGSEAAYIRAQAEAMAYLQWLKKFAVAYLSDADSQGKEKAP